MTTWPAISRETAMAAGTTLAGTIVVLGMFVVPNYARPPELQPQRTKPEQRTAANLPKPAGPGCLPARLVSTIDDAAESKS